MLQQGRSGLAGWIRTTWLPYTGRVPESVRDDFIADLVDDYIDQYPLDKKGCCHVPMVRLEVQGYKIK
jgi:trans-aconitate 2-methyltransferase